MRLLSVDGELWKLSLLTERSEKWVIGNEQEINDTFLEHGRTGCCRGIINFKQSDLRAYATALIEITVHGLPHQHRYEIYWCKKGHFCKVQGEKIYLKDLAGEAEVANA